MDRRQGFAVAVFHNSGIQRNPAGVGCRQPDACASRRQAGKRQRFAVRHDERQTFGSGGGIGIGRRNGRDAPQHGCVADRRPPVAPVRLVRADAVGHGSDVAHVQHAVAGCGPEGFSAGMALHKSNQASIAFRIAGNGFPRNGMVVDSVR